MHGYLPCGCHGRVAACGVGRALEVPREDGQEGLGGLTGAAQHAELRNRDTPVPFVVPRVLLIPVIAICHRELLVQQQRL